MTTDTPEVLAAELAKHWLHDTGCVHGDSPSGGSNKPSCACGWTGKRVPTVGDAVKDWAIHALSQLTALKPEAVPEAVERERERCATIATEAVFGAEFPDARWSCGMDESGMRLNLQRQKHWIGTEVRKAFTAIRAAGSTKGLSNG